MTPSATGQEVALAILRQFEEARSKLLGQAVILSDGKAGTISKVFLDELHGLRVSIEGHEGQWPISTIKLSEERDRR
ncbi:PRC-barrel domain containing protein [Bradyrhizobium sp. STM 3562]|uniref:PRC-barrel domain containing protein n=1 Tax=Bradyrhizobium sp. STM 3562 TaxID=578924 RepID=UPI0038910019